MPRTLPTPAAPAQDETRGVLAILAQGIRRLNPSLGLAVLQRYKPNTVQLYSY